jgi:hypothetical protein
MQGIWTLITCWQQRLRDMDGRYCESANFSFSGVEHIDRVAQTRPATSTTRLRAHPARGVIDFHCFIVKCTCLSLCCYAWFYSAKYTVKRIIFTSFFRTNSTELSPCREAASRPAAQGFPNVQWNPKQPSTGLYTEPDEPTHHTVLFL